MFKKLLNRKHLFQLLFGSLIHMILIMAFLYYFTNYSLVYDELDQFSNLASVVAGGYQPPTTDIGKMVTGATVNNSSYQEKFNTHNQELDNGFIYALIGLFGLLAVSVVYYVAKYNSLKPFGIAIGESLLAFLMIGAVEMAFLVLVATKYIALDPKNLIAGIYQQILSLL